MNEYCKEECFFGIEGPCSRSRYEYFTHCEKLYHNKVSQRGYPNEPQNIMEPKPIQPTTCDNSSYSHIAEELYRKISNIKPASECITKDSRVSGRLQQRLLSQ